MACITPEGIVSSTNVYIPGSPLEELRPRLPFALTDFRAVSELLERYRETGDPGAERPLQEWLYFFIRQYYLQRYLQGKIASLQDAEDVVGTLFLKVWRSLPQLRNPRQVGGWVLTACSRELNTYYRKKARRREISVVEDERNPEPVASDAGDTPVEILDTLILRSALERAIQRLPDYLQPVITLRYFKGYSTREIAEALGKDPGVIRSYLQRALRRLAEDPEMKNWLKG